jgi:hypothetical protein
MLMNKLKIAVVVIALLVPSAAQAQRGGAQSTQRQYIFDSRGKTVGFYYGPSSSSGHFNGMQQGVGDHSGEYNPFGAQLPKIRVDPNQKGWTPIWMREDSQEFEK